VTVMGIFEEYRELYEKHIVDKAKLLIVKYNPVKHQYEYKPYSHTVSSDAIDKLSELIIDNMVFYAFSEGEIVEQNNKFGLLDNLTIAARYAYEQRLPKRKNPNTDGTTGEVLLDILIQVFEPISQKLIARAKYKQQGDNNEIKGYDALYFVKNTEEISLWLGQVKTGACSYCKSSIVDDLNEKYVLDYFCNSVFYIADKADKSSDLLEILCEINKICFKSAQFNWDAATKKTALIDLLKNRNVKLKIPCLLAYTKDIYSDDRELGIKIKDSVQEMVDAFDQTDFNIINELEYELMFCVFPLSDVKALREKIVEFKKAGV
jgi:hypothetical protein